jgi:predicted PurR-regulated permease PerM
MATTGVPSVEPDDGSVLTPDVDPSTLAPPADPSAPQPDARKLGRLLGDDADVRHVALLGLLVLAVLYTLYIARDFLLPIALAILLDFMLSPVVRWLKRLRIPEAVGAGLVVLGLLAVVAIAAYRLSGPAAAWMARAPESFGAFEEKLGQFRRPVEQVTRAAAEVERATDMDDRTPEVQIKGPSLTEQFFGGTTALLGMATIVVFLTYFLLAVGDLFLQKLVTVLPQFRDKKKAVTIARETEASISTYLVTVTLMNIGLGITVAAAMFLLGMPNPILWGALAALAEFVPYLGATALVGVLALAGLVTFEPVGQALLVPAAYLGVNVLQSQFIYPLVLGHRLTLNPVAILVGLVFWWWIWGIPGAFLAVPLLATFKIFCDHIEALAPVGEFLGS